MVAINKATLMGRLGDDAELRQTQGGQVFAYLRVCTTEEFKNSMGELQTSKEWHTVKIWGPQSHRAAQLLKADHRVYIEGTIKSFKKNEARLWEIRATKWIALDNDKDEYLLPAEPINAIGGGQGAYYNPSPYGDGYTKR